MKLKILIIDDEKMLTDLLSQHFSDNGYICLVANSGEDGIKLLNNKPDIILLDINMPDMDGLTLCKRIREYVSCPIIFLTARVSEQDKINGLRIGGDDYVTKPFSLMELSARVEAHLRREKREKIEQSFMYSDGLTVNMSQRKVYYEGNEIILSKTEFDIMEVLMSNAKQNFDRERIYETVWGYDADGDSSVVKEHIRKIRTKLEKFTDKEFIETVWGIGYRWRK